MAQKPNHTSPDLLIHPGETIAEVLQDQKISQKELAIRTDFTEKHISTVVNGKKPISSKLALKLENALGISASFWKNLQTNYDFEVESFEEINNITSEETEISKDISKPVEVLTGKELDSKETPLKVWLLRQILGVNNLVSITKLASGAYRAQFDVNTNDYVMYVWQYLCEKQCEAQTENQLDIEKLQNNLSEIKSIMFEDSQSHVKLIQNTLNDCGVLFTVNKHVPKAPIHGLTVKTKKGQVMVAMTIRYKYVDTFWFSLFHEIAHVIYKDYLTDQKNEENAKAIEERANNFAKDILINPEKYENFVEKKDLTASNIEDFAIKNNVLPTIVVGRLMKDGYIPWNQNTLRRKYEWITD